jgi:ribosomal-protein-serine acetyltransferase
MRTEIYGEQIILRAYERSFAPMLYEAAIESRADAEFSRWMPWCHAEYTIEESRDFAEKAEAGWRDPDTDAWRDGRQFGYAIFDSENDKFLGGIGLNQPNKIHGFFNLGYWVRTSCQKRGVAGRATRILAKAAFEDLPVNRLEILVAIENIASQKAAEKAGARREGVLRKRLMIGGSAHDAVMFSFVREDFEA